MKKTAIFISLLVLGAFVANAQDETKTQSTSKTQNETKSSTTTTSPSKDASNSGTSTTTEGTMNDNSSMSTHNGTKLQLSDLPAVISQNIASQQKGWTPQEVYKIDNQGTTAYEVVVKKNDDEKNLLYDANGNLLRTEQKGSLGTSSTSTQPPTK